MKIKIWTFDRTDTEGKTVSFDVRLVDPSMTMSLMDAPQTTQFWMLAVEIAGRYSTPMASLKCSKKVEFDLGMWCSVAKVTANSRA